MLFTATSFGNDAHRGHELAFIRGGESVLDRFLHGLHVVVHRRIGAIAVGGVRGACGVATCGRVGGGDLVWWDFFPLLYV